MTYHKEYIALFLSLLITGLQLASAQSDLEVITARILQEEMKPHIEDDEIAHLLETQEKAGTWSGINYEDVSRTAFEHRWHLAHMVDLARAYQTQSSSYHQHASVKAAIERALKHWVENDYICDNWWHNQIGTPRELVSLMLIIGSELDKELVEKAQPMIGRAHVDAPGARPGGDRIKIAGIQAKNALFLNDADTFDEVVRIIEGEIKLSKWVGTEYGYGFRNIPTGFSNRQMGGRGIQHDYSFHHRVDGVNNTLSYGLGYAAAFAEWAVYTTGTRFAFSDERLEPLIDYFLDGICKTAIYGRFPDPGVKNRSISRMGTLKPYNATLAEKLLQTSDYRKDELQEIIAVRKKGIKPTLSHATYYWHSEHFSFQRPDWFTSVRMYSTRTHNMEQPYNSEGLLNHHRGDGANHLSLAGDEYLDIWPVYDYQKIPGATILQKPELPSPQEIQKLGITDFIGAASDGTYGTVAFDFRSAHDPLIGRKAWFFFDEQYVCLGTGISSQNRELPVFTTLNQAHLRGDVLLRTAGQTTPLDKGEHTYDQVEWIYHDQVGYVFLQPTTIQLSNQSQTGSWWRINKQSDSPKDEVTLDVFTLWLDHGIRPSDATYQYIVIPAISSEQLAQDSPSEAISILANTPQIQAVAHEGLNMHQVIFYQAGTIELEDGLTLTAHCPGIMILRVIPDGTYQLTVSDPNRELKTMHVSLSTRIDTKGEGYIAYYDRQVQATHLLIELPDGQYTGSSATVEW